MPKTTKKKPRRKPPAKTAGKLKLDIGGGSAKPGWTLIDRRAGQEAYPLPYPDGVADEINASHILEHFGHRETEAVLREWVRVLKPGGRIRVAVPDAFGWLQSHVDDGVDPEPHIMGGQTDANDYHKALFNRRGLALMLQRAGLIGIDEYQGKPGECSSNPNSINLEAYKPTEAVANAAHLRKIVAVASTSRVGFSDHAASLSNTIGQLGIPFKPFFGCNWGINLERALRWALTTDAEWILTLDFDSVWDHETIAKLAMLMETHPEADAIVPLQAKRESNHVLFNVNGLDVDPTDYARYEEPVAEIGMGHFGLTLIRASALRDLPGPWLHHEPSADAADPWGEGHTDDDVAFWRRFREHGKRVFVAPRVSIGHLQLMVSWPGENFQPVHQYVNDYRTHGKPVMVRR